MENKIQFKVWGRYALFTDPVTRLGGEKCSYHLPTYQALKGIVEAIYWKPTICWFIDKVRVMNKIKTQSIGVKPQKYNKDSENDLAIYTYLSDVEYQVSAHFEWNLVRDDLAHDRNENKHYFIAQRMLKAGGKHDVFLGTRECPGYVEPCTFGEGAGFYDNDADELSYGIMFHGYDYPTETGKEELWTRLWQATMQKGLINFIRPEECTIRKLARKMPRIARPTVGIEEEILREGGYYELAD